VVDQPPLRKAEMRETLRSNRAISANPTPTSDSAGPNPRRATPSRAPRLSGLETRPREGRFFFPQGAQPLLLPSPLSPEGGGAEASPPSSKQNRPGLRSRVRGATVRPFPLNPDPRAVEASARAPPISRTRNQASVRPGNAGALPDGGLYVDFKKPRRDDAPREAQPQKPKPVHGSKDRPVSRHRNPGPPPGKACKTVARPPFPVH